MDSTKEIIILKRDGVYDIYGEICDTQGKFLTKLREKEFDLALIEWNDNFKLTIVNFLHNVGIRAPLMPIILIHWNVNDPVIRRLVDLILPPETLLSTLETEIDNLYSRRAILTQNGMIGRSDSLYIIADIIFRVAPTDIPVLITGESGTGKEVVSQAIHRHSRRSDKPFLAVNSGAIPETLFESQLFGYKKGAFTGASKDTVGFLGQAKGGTIFLDEIGEIPSQIQVKLLRFIEIGEYFPVGSAEPKVADVRIIAATNKDLKVLLGEGKFREDLYYRISGVRIFIPPLRERPEDIPILAFYYANKAAEKHRVKFGGIGSDALEAMLSYHWPGNVRELRNLMENIAVLSEGQMIHAADVTHYFSQHQLVGRKLPVIHDGSSYARDVGRVNYDEIFGKILYLLKQNNELLHSISRYFSKPIDFDNAGKEAIIKALRESGGSRKKAAEILGISPRTLYRKINKYGL